MKIGKDNDYRSVTYQSDERFLQLPEVLQVWPESKIKISGKLRSLGMPTCDDEEDTYYIEPKVNWTIY